MAELQQQVPQQQTDGDRRAGSRKTAVIILAAAGVTIVFGVLITAYFRTVIRTFFEWIF
jgi:hypothetical protein